MKNLKVRKALEAVAWATVVVAGADLVVKIVRDLVSTKSSPEFGDDYKDSYEAGVDAAEEQYAVATLGQTSNIALEVLKAQQELTEKAICAQREAAQEALRLSNQVTRELVQTLRESNQDLIDLHAELLECMTDDSCHCHSVDDYDDCENHGDCEECGHCGSYEDDFTDDDFAEEEDFDETEGETEENVEEE